MGRIIYPPVLPSPFRWFSTRKPLDHQTFRVLLQRRRLLRSALVWLLPIRLSRPKACYGAQRSGLRTGVCAAEYPPGASHVAVGGDMVGSLFYQKLLLGQYCFSFLPVLTFSLIEMVRLQKRSSVFPFFSAFLLVAIPFTSSFRSSLRYALHQAE
jgi:hypothetical protein